VHAFAVLERKLRPTFAFARQLSYLNWRESCGNLTRLLDPMTLLTVIPARLGSTRLASKPLRLVGGVPLVVRVYQQVTRAALGGDCVVATDSDAVLAICETHAVPAVMTSEHHPSGTDRVAEVARRPEFRHHAVILNVQGDEPFITHEALAAAVGPVLSGDADIGTVAVVASDDILRRPDVVKVVQSDHGRALYFSRAPIPFLRDASDVALLAPHVRQHVGVYAYTRDALMRWVAFPPHGLELIERLEQLRPLAHGLSIAVAALESMPEGGIDTEDDLARANAHWATFAAAALATKHSTQIPSPS
jgi:3-deoxy-manno-octulosonate cytidylyltransferase (CMP-KDO synthetase)